MKKSVRKFLKFNGKTIYFLAVDGQYWIALKPICEALSVNFDRQYKNIKSHNVFGRVYANQPMHDSSRRIQKMVCLPEMYIYGWIFRINSSSKELANYQEECCNVLFSHFRGTITQRREILADNVDLVDEQKLLESKLAENPDVNRLAEVKKAITQNGKSLKMLDAELVNPQMSMFD